MSKMKKCKTCGLDIAKSTKFCPHCGEKNSSSALRIAAAIVLLLLGIALLLPSDGDGSEKGRVYSVGETATEDYLYIKLLSVEESRGANYLYPQDGYVFLVCEFSINNTGDYEVAVSSLLSFEAYVDDYSTQVDISAMASSSSPQLDGKIAPNKKMQGVVGYQVPEDWQEFEIRYGDVKWLYTK